MNAKIFFIFGLVFTLFIVLSIHNDFNYRPIFLLNWKIKTKHVKANSNSNITKIIHQSWKTRDIPVFFQKYTKSWTNHCYIDWKYILWTDEDNLNLIKIYYPWFLKKYNDLPANIYRVDMSRYFYLFHYGGIYTDLDNECIKPFDHLLQNYSLVFGAMKGQFGGTNLKEGYVQNSFMYSRPKHPFWLEVIMDVLNSNSRAIPEIVTGPILLSNKIRDFIQRPKMDREIIIYQPNYFNPFSWLQNENVHCKDRNRMNQEEYEKCKASMIAKGSYVIQFHTHNWR